METLIYIANGMNLLGYCMKDMLRLRVMMLLAASCLAIYFYSLPEPLMTVVGWNLFYVGLNLLQIARLLGLCRRLKIRFTASAKMPSLMEDRA